MNTTASTPTAEVIAARTGGDIRSIHPLRHGGADQAIVLAGTVLTAIRSDGATGWIRGDLGVSRIVEVLPELGVIAIGRRDRVHLIGLDDGAVLWTWRHPDGREVVAPGSTRVIPDGNATLLLVAPGYATAITCVELGHHPRERWTRDLSGTIDAGFGPVMIAADVLGRGTPQLVLSSRTGSGYGTDDVANERLVLGRDDGQLYQAVLDLGDGTLLAETTYRPDPGDYPAARPYGLLQAGPSAAGDIVLVSCQVEEYAAVTATDGGLRRRWGWFVEKDWPLDLQELRPQTTSVADVLGDGRPRLVVGHWDGTAWFTRVLDVLGPASEGTSLDFPGRYFWGTADLDGDGVAEIITSLETERRPRSRTRLEVLDARTGAPAGALDDITLLTVDDEPLPADRVFHADRRGAAVIRDAQGRAGLVLIDPAGPTMWWHLGPSRADAPQELLPDSATRVADRSGGAALGDASGGVHFLDGQLRVTASLRVSGRASRPLLMADIGGPRVIVDHASGVISGPGWSKPGSHAALHRADDTTYLVIAGATAVGSRVTVHVVDDAEPRQMSTWDVPGIVDGVLAFGDRPTILALRRIGPHSAALTAFDLHGSELWRDDERGVHANEPLAFWDGGWRIATDDHGVLTVRDATDGSVLADADWTAAYTTPMVAELDGVPVLVRADGTHGVELCTTDGRTIWRRGYEIFAVHPGTSVVAGDDVEPLLAVPRRDGIVDILRLRDGRLMHDLDVGDQAERRPMLAVGNLILVGTLAGDVIAIDPLRPGERWRRRYPAAIEGLAATASADEATVAVVTADGDVRLLTLGSP